MDKSRVRVSDLTEDYVNAHYYAPRFLENEKRLASCGIPRRPIGELGSKCNCGATPVDVAYDGEGQGLIRTSDVRPNRFEAAKVLRTKSLNVSRDGATAAVSDDLLFTMSGTIGYAAVIPESDEVFSFSNTIARVRFLSDGEFDPRFIAVFFNSDYGYTQSLRLTSGGIQGHVMPNPFKRMLVPTPSKHAQKYVGEKVRQAERLRRSAQELQSCINHLLMLGPLQQAMTTPNDRTNRVRSGLLESRLDAKFYSPRSMRIFEAAFACDGVRLGDLNPKISNGFEHRSFVEQGRAYVTVTQVGSLRLDLTGAPRIPESVQVPARAKLTERTVLAVRSGATIGTVVKAQAEDCHACVSSHFIILRFSTESVAAAVATFLNSEVGRSLQDKIVYGGVIPQISQDDLLSLPIPKAILDAAEQVASWEKARELALRNAQRLVVSAKLLVESLIEGRLAESDFVNAQLALERGERALDLAILKRLTECGIDLEGKPPLFPDIDALYAAIDESQRTRSSNGDAA